jgi:hypothetical protein
MHRFWSDLDPDALASKVAPLFKATSPVILKSHERLLLGPKQMPVSELELTEQIGHLHMQLYAALNKLGIEYTAPEWVGSGYRAHVTERKNAHLEVGSEHTSQAAYLIEVEVPGHDHQRLIRHKFVLGQL